jgi:DNA-binding beta-propeller fold protein YncE
VHGTVLSRCPPDVCVAVVLGDALRRVSALSGREGMPRSLGSIYAGNVTRFLGGSCRGVESRVIATPGLQFVIGAAVSVDGCTLLLADHDGVSQVIHEFKLLDGSRRRAVGCEGSAPLQFIHASGVGIAPDGCVFVADAGNDRVQVLTPDLAFCCFIGVGQLERPSGVCANDDVIVVTESPAHRVTVFNRRDGSLRHRFGSHGRGDGQLKYPNSVCILASDRHVAIADTDNCRVSVFSVDGEFIRHVGTGRLKGPSGVACSAFDELVVADYGSRCLFVFSATGDVLAKVGRGKLTGVALHGGTVVAVSSGASTVRVLE